MTEDNTNDLTIAYTCGVCDGRKAVEARIAEALKGTNCRTIEDLAKRYKGAMLLNGMMTRKACNLENELEEMKGE